MELTGLASVFVVWPLSLSLRILDLEFLAVTPTAQARRSWAGTGPLTPVSLGRESGCTENGFKKSPARSGGGHGNELLVSVKGLIAQPHLGDPEETMRITAWRVHYQCRCLDASLLNLVIRSVFNDRPSPELRVRP